MRTKVRTASAAGALWAARTVEWARESLAMSAEEIGAAVGATGRTITRWASRTALPRPTHRERIEKLNELRHLLDAVFESRAAAQRWLYTPVPAFRGRTPHSLVRSGRLDDVIGLLAAMESGAFV